MASPPDQTLRLLFYCDLSLVPILHGQNRGLFGRNSADVGRQLEIPYKLQVIGTHEVVVTAERMEISCLG